MKRVTGKAVCSVAAKRLVTKTLQIHKEHAGSLLKIVKPCKSKELKILGRVVTQLRQNPTFKIQLTNLQRETMPCQ